MPYKDPEKKKQSSREAWARWAQAHPGARANRKQWPSARHRYSIASRLAHRAQAAVYRAIKRGELVRPAVCAQCGKGGRIEAAHADYARPLDIRWLCVSCHRAWDANAPKGGNVPSGAADDSPPPPARGRLFLDFICPVCTAPFRRTYHDSLRKTATPCCSKSCGMRLSRRRRRGDGAG